MTIKKGNVVCHSGAMEWGVGKVVEINTLKATILFCDGSVRKISSSHYSSLKPTDAALYVPVAATPVKTRSTASKGTAGKTATKAKKAKAQPAV